MIEFEIDAAPIQRLASRFDAAPRIVGEEMRRGMESAVQEAADSVRSFVPIRTGQTARSIVGRIDQIALPEIRGSVVALKQSGRPEALARWLNDGTRPHQITARNKKVLRFSAGGSFIFRRTIQHPGTRPIRFMERGLELARPRIVRIMSARLGNVSRRLARG